MVNTALPSMYQPQSDILPLSQSAYSAQLFRTSLFSDCTVRSNHRIWHLHRCILSPRCEFFYRCFSGDFEEAGSASVEMHEDDPETLGRLLKWIYLLEFPALATESERRSSWTSDLMLYMMADKYGLAALMDATRRDLLEEATRCGTQPERFSTSVNDFVKAMTLLFEELPDREDLDRLREDLLLRLAPVIATHMRKLPVLEELMKMIPGFGVALVESLAEARERRRSSSSLESCSAGSSSSNLVLGANAPPNAKRYIPMNEDSEDELE